MLLVVNILNKLYVYSELLGSFPFCQFGLSRTSLPFLVASPAVVTKSLPHSFTASFADCPIRQLPRSLIVYLPHCLLHSFPPDGQPWRCFGHVSVILTPFLEYFNEMSTEVFLQYE